MKQKQKRKRRSPNQRKTHVWRVVSLILEVFAIVGLLVLLTIRDGFPIISMLYYATPWPVVTMRVHRELLPKAKRHDIFGAA